MSRFPSTLTPSPVRLVQLMLLGAVIAVPGLAHSQAKPTAPYSAYTQLPSLEQVAISPDGARLAGVHVESAGRILTFTDVQSGTVKTRLNVGTKALRGLQWIDAHRILIKTDVYQRVSEKVLTDDRDWVQGRIYDVLANSALPIPFKGTDVDTGTNLFNALLGPVSVREVKGQTVIIYAYPQAAPPTFVTQIVRLNLDTGETGSFGGAGSYVLDWLADEQGYLLAEDIYSQDSQVWNIRMVTANQKTLHTVASGKSGINVPHLLGLYKDDTVLYSSSQTAGVAWAPMNRRDGKWGTVLPPDLTSTAVLKNRLNDEVIGGVSVADEATYKFFDPEKSAAWDKVRTLFGDEHPVLVSWTDDFSKMVVSVDGVKDGFGEFLVDVNTMHSTLVGHFLSGITSEFATQVVHYQSGDAQEVTGYLTLPDRPAKNLPLVVIAHDGPQWRDTALFDVWSQALASQGYAVLRANFRGSAGILKWTQAGYGEWGRKMQSDLSDGVAELARQGLIDPARVCIMGSGYGGYAAVAGVTLQAQGLYRCTVSISGVLDPKRLIKDATGAKKGSALERSYLQFMGATGPDDASLDAISPWRHVAGMQAPVLLIHGRKDTVSVEHSEDFFDSMKGAGKDVTILKPQSENDLMQRPESRQAVFDATLAFLKKNNPPD